MSCCTVCNTSFDDLLIDCPDPDYPFMTSIYCHQCNKCYVNCEHCSIYQVRTRVLNNRQWDYFKQHIKLHKSLQHGLSSATNNSTCNNSSQATSSILPNIPQVDYGAFNSDNDTNNMYQMFIDSGLKFGSKSSDEYFKILLEHDTMLLQCC